MSEKHDAMWGTAGEEIASLHAEIERLKQENQDLKDRFARIAAIFTEHEKKMSKL